ncbi:hypothetical protein OF83DRAFT_1020175, partial [Amylostereum chailletii]
GLFGATVAAFIVESYKGLQPSPSDVTNALLAQLAALANTTASHHSSPLPASSFSFHTPPSSVRVNILWFSSVCLSLTCAMGATLVQQWARSY